jgi:thiol:disulfide interchange protein DsbA
MICSAFRYTIYELRYTVFIFPLYKEKGINYILDGMEKVHNGGLKEMVCVLWIVCALLLGLAQPDTADSREMSFLAFGNGKIDVRLYADYFCGPCSALEPKIEYPILDLVRRDIITITFVDTPFYKYSALYARYFLYVLNEKKELRHALTARAAFFEAAKAKINEREKLEAFLLAREIRFKPFEVKPVFNILQGYLREDKISSTPSCVIRNGDKKEVYTGGENIIKALEALR